MAQRTRSIGLALVAFAISSQSGPAGATTPRVSPLAPNSAAAISADKHRVADIKRVKAHVSRAAISTEDVSQIKFQEYYVDWSGWMADVADRWSFVFNTESLGGKFQTCGPALVQFTCFRDGTIGEISIERSSGDSICDHEQISALKDCVPLPAFPAGSRKQSVTLLYVWDYASKSRIVKQVKPQSQSQNIERISVTGKTM